MIERDADRPAAATRRLGRQVMGLFAIMAMGSWVVLAAIPMVVAIIALT